jgi:hypothetical protein
MMNIASDANPLRFLPEDIMFHHSMKESSVQVLINMKSRNVEPLFGLIPKTQGETTMDK